MLTEQVEGHVVGTLGVPGLELAGGAHVDDVHGRVLVAHADELAGGDGRRSSGPGISGGHRCTPVSREVRVRWVGGRGRHRSEEHTSELQSLMRISYAVFCLQKKHK